MLRDIVRRHVENQTLRLFLQDKYDSASFEEKDRLLNNLRSMGTIDTEVDNILNVFINSVEKKSVRKKRRKWWTIAYAGLNVILTTLISYASKQDLWTLVGGLAMIFILIQGINIFFNEN
ncbi:MAG: hypothetical protein K6T66_05845 [Peptococcaceae bacterium]|nr:hypothetical protein [Peptococcaceae bacterium]